MPILNSRGDVICGAGGEPGSLNQQLYPFTSYGGGCWLDDDTILVSLVSAAGIASAGGALYGWHPFSDASASSLWQVDPRPFNTVAGGGGKYVASIEGGSPLLYGSLGDLSGAGAGDVSSDGTIVYKTSYFAGSGLTIVSPSGTSVSRPDAYPLGFQALTNGQAIWPGGAEGRAPASPFFANALNLKLATLNGQDWLLYWSQGAGVVLQPDGGGEGFLFVSDTMFNADLIALNDDVLIVVSSTTQGEAPQDLTKIAANQSGVRYLVGSGPVPTWGPL